MSQSILPGPRSSVGSFAAPQKRIRWAYVIPIAAVHLLALLVFVPWLFTWVGVIAFLLGIHGFGQAINVGYHRLLSHRSFKTPKWVERTYVLMALCCMQDTPVKWVAVHRLHHQHSDDLDDPHSPLPDALWGHMNWLFVDDRRTHRADVYMRYARDLLEDPFYMRLEKSVSWLWIYALHAVLFAAVGAAIGWFAGGTWAEANRVALSMLVWGVFARTVAVWHITWSVNSLSHLFGYRNYETTDQSRNNWLVAFLACGEGWHNNHHADPASASLHHRWWEFDLSYCEIRLLQLVGLAWDVIPPRQVRQAGRT